MEDEFHLAASHLETLLDKLPESSKDEDLLYLYARYKQATIGPCNTPKPSFFNFAARKKWTSWNSLADMHKDIAMTQYIDKIKVLDTSWCPKSTKVRTGMGICVSTLNHVEEDHLADEDKDIFDWCKEGSLDKVKTVLSGCGSLPADEEGRSLLHWACDRGHYEIVKYLLEIGHDVNCTDGDQATPLHYSSSCGHLKIVELLLKNKADRTMQDGDGETAVDCASSNKVRFLLENNENCR